MTYLQSSSPPTATYSGLTNNAPDAWAWHLRKLDSSWSYCRLTSRRTITMASTSKCLTILDWNRSDCKIWWRPYPGGSGLRVGRKLYGRQGSIGWRGWRNQDYGFFIWWPDERESWRRLRSGSWKRSRRKDASRLRTEHLTEDGLPSPVVPSSQ